MPVPGHRRRRLVGAPLSSPTMYRPAVCLLAALAGLVCGAGVAGAHDFWMEPTTFRPAVGERVSLILRVGQDFSGNRQPYIPDWFSDYRVAGPDAERPVTGFPGDDPAGGFTPAVPGLHVVGYRSTRDYVELEPDLFRKYLRMEGMERIMALRAERGESNRPAHEFYSRCAKSLVLAGAAGPGSGHDRLLGYTLELVPERNPYALGAGATLPLRLLYEGEPLEGALVIAFTRDQPESKLEARTDAEGRVRLRLPHTGVWLVKAVHMVPAPPDAKAEWESFWASLTFELPGG